MNNATVNAGHPTNYLYVVVSSPLNDELMNEFEDWLTELPSRRSWVIQSPELVDYLDEGESTGESMHTYGCALRMYSALPPWGEKLPKEIDRQHLEETEFLLKELAAFSQQSGCEFKLQLDRTPVGSIVHGAFDQSIQIGLIGEWRKAHGLSAAGG